MLGERDIQKRGLIKLIIGVAFSLVGIDRHFALGVGPLVEIGRQVAVSCGTEGFSTNLSTDAGDANGDLNRVRTRHSRLPQVGARKRTEDRDDGVVPDYLWDAGNWGEWNQIHSGTPLADAATDAVEAMTGQYLDSSSIAECCTLGATQRGDLNGGSFQAENHGIMAFGWNGEPFAFDGCAGGRVSRYASK